MTSELPFSFYDVGPGDALSGSMSLGLLWGIPKIGALIWTPK